MLARKFEISVVTHYRLDLTVSVLRRLSTNIVDLLTPESGYVRALSGFPRPVIVCAAPIPHRHALCVTIDGDECHDADVLQLLRRTLGTDRDIAHFHRAARHIAWLAPLARRMRGVKPPRYPSLWEACANAIVFQQVSLRAASTIMEAARAACLQSVTTEVHHEKIFLPHVRIAADARIAFAGYRTSCPNTGCDDRPFIADSPNLAVTPPKRSPVTRLNCGK